MVTKPLSALSLETEIHTHTEHIHRETERRQTDRHRERLFISKLKYKLFQEEALWMAEMETNSQRRWMGRLQRDWTQGVLTTGMAVWTTYAQNLSQKPLPAHKPGQADLDLSPVSRELYLRF